MRQQNRLNASMIKKKEKKIQLQPRLICNPAVPIRSILRNAVPSLSSRRGLLLSFAVFEKPQSNPPRIHTNKFWLPP